MDAISDPEVETVVIMSSAQVGKTEIINNVAGFFIEHDPSPILVVQPTVEMGETWSKDRLAPMIRDTPVLTDLVADPKSRGSGNTIRHKTFPGGHITIAGANSPASLASRPIRVVLLDEVDRYPHSAGTEGDPVSLAIKRATTFWNRKVVLVSTPTIRRASRIESWWERSDRARFMVPCPECTVSAPLTWQQVKWDNTLPRHERAQSARYLCASCKAELQDHDLIVQVRAGHWESEAPEQRMIRGFHINELYSPWVPLAETVDAFLFAKDAGPDVLKVWVNTSLGETWEEAGVTVDADVLHATRREHYQTVPREAEWLTMGVDVQKDRIEAEIVGWNAGRESWSLDYRVLYGDPQIPATEPGSVWAMLDEILATEFAVEGGGSATISSTLVDAGYLPDAVLPYCRDRGMRGVYACRGESGEGKAVLHRRSRNNRYHSPVFFLGVDGIKERIYGMLTIEAPNAPGYCHFPAEYSIDYFKQLTSERLVERKNRGFTVREWELPANARNEALDVRVYAYAALERIAPRRSTVITNRSMQLHAERQQGAGTGPDFFAKFRGFGEKDWFKP